MHIRPCQYIHTALLIYPYDPEKIFKRPCHTDQLDYLIKVLRTGCFSIGRGINSRSAELALGPTGLGANIANLESIPGSIQKQPVSNAIIHTVLGSWYVVEMIMPSPPARVHLFISLPIYSLDVSVHKLYIISVGFLVS